MSDETYERIRKALLAACVLYALVGLALAFAGSALFGWWRDLIAEALFGLATLPPSLRELAELTDGILGGSIVGKWVAAAWLVHEPLRRRERWGAYVLLASHLAWFVVDSAASLWSGAAVNIIVINVIPLLLVGGLCVALVPGTVHAPPRPRSVPRSVRALTVVCAMSAGAGLGAAFAIRSVLFAPYNAAMAERFFEGATFEAWVSWEVFTYGLIGGTIVGHFVALLGALVARPDERWTLCAVVSSVVAWFVVDSTVSVLHTAWFNLLMVNAPSLIAVLIPAAFAWRALAGPALKTSAPGPTVSR